MNITKPTAIIWKERSKFSLKKMNQKCLISKTELRPHFKTHQNLEIANWCRSEGITKITVSSVEMAEFFSNDNWNDILIAFPINIREIDKINEINKKIEHLHLLVESREVLEFLEQKLENSVKVWIKIDIGYARTGIDYSNIELITKLASEITNSTKLHLEGLLTHAGHAYNTNNKDIKLRIHQDGLERLNVIKNVLKLKGFDIKLSSGDTPTCSVVENFSGLDEIRPGNFILYDITQYQLGNCIEQDIAIAIACPVVAKHKERLEVVIYGGGVHFSKDSLKYSDDTKFYGYYVENNSNGTWNEINKNNYLKSISQEHGILKLDEKTFEKIQIGELAYILPIHSCLAMDLLKNNVNFVSDLI